MPCRDPRPHRRPRGARRIPASRSSWNGGPEPPSAETKWPRARSPSSSRIPPTSTSPIVLRVGDGLEIHADRSLVDERAEINIALQGVADPMRDGLVDEKIENSPQRPGATYTRELAEHFWPPNPKADRRTPSVALSRSARGGDDRGVLAAHLADRGLREDGAEATGRCPFPPRRTR